MGLMATIGRRVGRGVLAGLVMGAVAVVGVVPAGAAERPPTEADPAGDTSTLAPPTWPTLRPGSRGTDVRTVQYLLRVHQYTVVPDGVYGPATKARVARFQQANHLAADGVVGPRTWWPLVVDVVSYSRGDHVRALQLQLRYHGHDVAVDGIVGPLTEAAIRQAQYDHALPVTGEVDKHTWHELLRRGP